jgi:hypothetical protein
MLRDLTAARILAVLLPLVLVGCGAPRYAANWDGLRPGMTRSEVVDLLGEPASRVRLEQPGSTAMTRRGRHRRPGWESPRRRTSSSSRSGPMAGWPTPAAPSSGPSPRSSVRREVT